ncbi:hypothetical protein HNY73_014193 [Argiope bruennichi]|uniref:Uncharacterized protein n=1 Tax=Argiope bruennichi TaxID=94029 RepID=A0A8T0ETH9_ARGBR|nr:hypothetical protein HNY73_014193 [Argiope bruennichi]
MCRFAHTEVKERQRSTTPCSARCGILRSAFSVSTQQVHEKKRWGGRDGSRDVKVGLPMRADVSPAPWGTAASDGVVVF